MCIIYTIFMLFLHKYYGCYIYITISLCKEIYWVVCLFVLFVCLFVCLFVLFVLFCFCFCFVLFLFCLLFISRNISPILWLHFNKTSTETVQFWQNSRVLHFKMSEPLVLEIIVYSSMIHIIISRQRNHSQLELRT